MHILKLCLLMLLCAQQIYANNYKVTITSNGPIVQGATIQFKATVYNGNKPANEKLKFMWQDNAIFRHEKEEESSDYINVWNVTYDKNKYPFGEYDVQVVVESSIMAFIWYEVASARYSFYITETLNGNLDLIQQNKTRENNYVASCETLTLNASIKSTDLKFIETAPTISTFWFIDCVYYGFNNNFSYLTNYTKAGETHLIEALIVADFTPLPPPVTTTIAPSTTSLKPNTTTTTVKPTTSSTTTTSKPTKPSNHTINLKHVKRSVEKANNQSSNIKVYKNGTLVPYEGSFPFVCNSTKVATDPNKTYGYFSKSITVKDPVRKVNITGNNWLQHGDLLSLNVQCEASKPLKYCVDYHKGNVNVTGNETCTEYYPLDECKFPIQRYLAESMEHTIIIILENDVSKVVKSVTVTIYKAKVQAQLSVVVVPVAFSLVAVVIVVFGVAYYFQNRSRYVVEVADFNFGHTYTDMEYKTFKERLRDSIVNAFTRAPSPSSSEVPVWPPGGRKYGSMT